MKQFNRVFALVVLSLLAACTSAYESDILAPAFTSDRISVTTRGNGPDIILIPGLTVHRDAWGPALDILDDRYRLHLVQVNGFAGFAVGANADGPVSAPVAEEIARYIRERRLDHPAVVGHSMGGTIGMMLASRHPTLVGRLMVVDMMSNLGAVFSPPGSGPEQIRQAADQFRAMIQSKPLSAPDHMLAQMFASMTQVDSMKPVLLRHLAASDARTVGNAFHELITTDLRPELAKITAPVTVLYVQPHVEMTHEQFDAAMRDMYANAKNLKLVRVDGSAHFIHLDVPARFVAEVDALMRR